MTKTVDLNGLAAVMVKIGQAVMLDVNDLVTEITMSNVAELALNTPVDVGTARSNWITSLDTAPTGRRGAFSPHPSRWRPPYARPGADRSETRNQAGAVWSARGVVARRKPDQGVYISNNLPYIQRLNEGWSDQSPAGFIETAVDVGTQRAIRSFDFKNLKRL